MRPDAPAAKSPIPSRDGSEAPSSPALAAAAPATRPKLNLAKRTISEAPDQPSPTVSASGDASKPNPFGAATPADTATREREIEEKRLAAIQEKKEAEEKAKADAREAAKAAKAAEAEKAETAEANKKVEILQRGEGEEPASQNGETIEKENANGEVVDDKSVKPKEIVRDIKPARPSETGAWRRPSGGPPAPRDDNVPRGPRGGRGGARGGNRGQRGGHYEEGGRGNRQASNGGRPAPAAAAATAPQTPSAEPEAAVLEEDGWSTVSKPKKNNRGGNAGSRAIAS